MISSSGVALHSVDTHYINDKRQHCEKLQMSVFLCALFYVHIQLSKAD